MTGGQEKNFSTLGPKLRENRARQYYGDKSLQIRVETTNYSQSSLNTARDIRDHRGDISIVTVSTPEQYFYKSQEFIH